MCASQEGHKDIVQYLVQQGAKVDIQCKVQSIDIDLTCVWILCNISVIITLVDIGWIHSIDVGIPRGTYGSSAIFSAARSYVRSTKQGTLY